MKSVSDFLVIGSGIAGLSYALKVAEHGRVAVVTKREIDTTATSMAQGGIAAVATATDSFAEHIRDTMEAGAWLSDEAIVRLVVEEGPAAIAELIGYGARFSRGGSGEYDLTREGGDRPRRIYHAKGETRKEIGRALGEATRAHPNITLYRGYGSVS